MYRIEYWSGLRWLFNPDKNTNNLDIAKYVANDYLLGDITKSRVICVDGGMVVYECEHE